MPATDMPPLDEKATASQSPTAVAITPPDALRQAKQAYQAHSWPEAEKYCRLLLATTPGNFDTLNLLGMITAQTQRLHEAAELLSKAIALEPERVEAYGNLANVLHDLNRHDDALNWFERALALSPHHAQLHCNRGIVLHDLRRHDEALKSYENAIRIQPEYAEARWNMALLHLQRGDLLQGWEGHELRWKAARSENEKPSLAQPMWQGVTPLAGKTILLHGEAGLGDTLQFCRYVPRVAALGARTILVVQAGLAPVLKNLNGASQVLSAGDVLPEIDYHCPLMSLPRAFKTDIHSIPADTPYLFSDAARVALWRQRLGKKNKPRVGLAWSGNAMHKNDRNRSLAFEQLLPLLDRHAEWISLQKEVRACDRELLSSCQNIRHFGEQLEDFSDTAALVEHMDLIITVDTSVAHLAGAMGKPVWILLPFNPDWRWMLDRDDSPWYPTARLFRQSAFGDWSHAIRDLADNLQNQLDKTGGDTRSAAMHKPPGFWLWVTVHPRVLIICILFLVIALFAGYTFGSTPP